MTKIALIGAGGKMGCRLTDNLLRTDYELLAVEPGSAGIARLAERGVDPAPAEEAVPTADVVILAVPDNRIGQVSEELLPIMRDGATLIVLDAAAPYAGRIPSRSGISQVACHPCHPSLWNHEERAEDQKDHFGGVAAKQDVVIALIEGSEADYARAEPIVRAFFAPVVNSHRVTVRDMILLEPVLAETTAATCAVIIKEALDETVRRGVSEEAARAFLYGHLKICIAIAFGVADNPFSDGALKAIETAKGLIFKEDWKRVFDEDVLRASVEEIVATE